MLAVGCVAAAERARSARWPEDNRLAAVAPGAVHADSVLGMATMKGKWNWALAARWCMAVEEKHQERYHGSTTRFGRPNVTGLEFEVQLLARLARFEHTLLRMLAGTLLDVGMYHVAPVGPADSLGHLEHDTDLDYLVAPTEPGMRGQLRKDCAVLCRIGCTKAVAEVHG